MKNTVKKELSPVWITLLGILIMVALLLGAKYTLFLAVLLPFVGAYVTARLQPSWSVVYYVAAAAACYLLLPKIWVVAFLMLLFSSALTGIALKKRLRTYEGVMLSCAGWVMGFAVIIAASYLVYGTDPLSMIVDKIRSAAESSDDAATMFYLIYENYIARVSANLDSYFAVLTEVQNVLYEAQIDVMRETVLSSSGMAYYNNAIAQQAPAMALQLSLLGGLFSYLLARLRLKRVGVEVSPISAMKDFKLPRGLTTPLAVIFILAYLATSFIELPMTLLTACSIMLEVCSVVFSVQAVTLIHWFICLRSKNKGTIIALSIVIPVVASLFQALPWLGFFEMLFKLRYNVIIKKN